MTRFHEVREHFSVVAFLCRHCRWHVNHDHPLGPALHVPPSPRHTWTHPSTHPSEFTAHLYLLNSHSNKIKLAWWNPTFVLSDGGMKWDSINTCSPIGLAGWLPAEAALKRLGAAIMQVELQRRWGWGGDDSALITGSEQGVIRFSRERWGLERVCGGEVDWLQEQH